MGVTSGWRYVSASGSLSFRLSLFLSSHLPSYFSLSHSLSPPLSLLLSLPLPLLSLSASLCISANKKQYFSDERSASGMRYDFASGIHASLSFDAPYKFGGWRKNKKKRKIKYAPPSVCRAYKPSGRTKVENIFQIHRSRA